MYLSIFLSIYLHLYLYLSLSISIYLSISICLYLSLSISISIYLYLYLSLSTSIYIYLYLFISIYIYLYLSLSLYLSISLSLYLSISLSIYLSICKFENEAILRDFLNFWTWQRQKRTNSAGLPQCLKLTTSKTKQFCETSFKNGRLSVELTASYQCVLRSFHSTCLKYCACHEKVMPGHTKCCACHARSSSQNWRSQVPKCNPSQEFSTRTS